jgi:hypothetical protein
VLSIKYSEKKIIKRKSNYQEKKEIKVRVKKNSSKKEMIFIYCQRKTNQIE